RRAIVPCARGWSPSASCSVPTIPIGGMRRYRHSATATPGWRSSALLLAGKAPIARAGPSPAISPASYSTRLCSNSGSRRENIAPDGRVLLSSYHCSRYNQNTRKLDAAMFESVFERALELCSTAARGDQADDHAEHKG